MRLVLGKLRVRGPGQNPLSAELHAPRCDEECPPPGGLARQRAKLLWIVLSPTPAHRLPAARPTRAALVDLALATAALAASLALLSHGGGGTAALGSRGLDWTGGALAACSTLPLGGWRRAPRTVFALTALAAVLLGSLGYPVGLPLGPLAALYLLVSSRDDGQLEAGRRLVIVLTLLAAYLLATAVAGGLSRVELLHTALAWAVAWFAGERTRLRRDHIAELKQRALRAEREAERERRLASAEARARIARDLHDSAGHAINVIALRAGTARLRHEANPERGRDALNAIEHLARQTAEDIDRIVGALRDDDTRLEEIAARPGLASLDTLLAHRMTAGLDVTIATAGQPRPLPAAVDQTAYRILQEGLTNAARHGTGGAHIDLRYGETALDLTISNPADPEAVPSANQGHGLIGMRERIALLAGDLDAQRSNGSFHVRARLPFGGGGS